MAKLLGWENRLVAVQELLVHVSVLEIDGLFDLPVQRVIRAYLLHALLQLLLYKLIIFEQLACRIGHRVIRKLVFIHFYKRVNLDSLPVVEREIMRTF